MLLRLGALPRRSHFYPRGLSAKTTPTTNLRCSRASALFHLSEFRTKPHDKDICFQVRAARFCYFFVSISKQKTTWQNRWAIYNSWYFFIRYNSEGVLVGAGERSEDEARKKSTIYLATNVYDSQAYSLHRVITALSFPMQNGEKQWEC